VRLLLSLPVICRRSMCRSRVRDGMRGERNSENNQRRPDSNGERKTKNGASIIWSMCAHTAVVERRTTARMVVGGSCVILSIRSRHFRWCHPPALFSDASRKSTHMWTRARTIRTPQRRSRQHSWASKQGDNSRGRQCVLFVSFRLRTILVVSSAEWYALQQKISFRANIMR
jgi:hypothetical protein